MTKNSVLSICDVTIHPGERTHLALPFPELYSCTDIYMPIKVLHGKRSGPCLLIFSAVRGNEMNGIEIIARLLEHPALENIAGTLIAVPVLNVFGMVNYPKTLPGNVALSDCFPGNEHGSFGERIAHIFTKEILSKATCCVELQTGDLNHAILPQVFCSLNDKNHRDLARQFQTPVINNVNMDNNPLRQTAESLNIPLLVYQAGEAMRFDEAAIQIGLNGLLKLMHHLKLLDKLPVDASENFKPTFSQDEDWLRAPRSGVLHSKVELGQMISKGERIGLINDPFSADIELPVKAPKDGIVVGINKHPLIYEGQSIFKIASFIDNDLAESAIGQWGESQPDYSA